MSVKVLIRPAHLEVEQVECGQLDLFLSSRRQFPSHPRGFFTLVFTVLGGSYLNMAFHCIADSELRSDKAWFIQKLKPQDRN